MYGTLCSIAHVDRRLERQLLVDVDADAVFHVGTEVFLSRKGR